MNYLRLNSCRLISPSGMSFDSPHMHRYTTAKNATAMNGRSSNARANFMRSIVTPGAY